LYNGLINPAAERPPLHDGYVLSWEDCARSIRHALEAASLPSPYEVFNLSARLPHGQISSDKARRLLGWEPQEELRHLWSAPAPD
jgi:hypothetical protein